MGSSLKRCSIALLFLLCFQAFAQNKDQVEIQRADVLVSGTKDGIKGQKLIGNVIFKHQNTLMYCDSAFLYSESNKIDAYGSIRINQEDTLNLYGDELRYFGDEGLAIVSGETVKLIGKEYTLTTDQLYYNRIANSASYKTGGLIVSNQDSNILRSVIGYYFMSQSLFRFKDSVSLSNPDFEMLADTLEYSTASKVVTFVGPTTITGDSNLIYCEDGYYNTIKDQSRYFNNAYIISDGRKVLGDTLYYDRVLAYGQADGHVQIIDTAENIVISGEHSEVYEAKDSAVVTDQCLLTQIFSEDSLFLKADTFKLFGSSDSERKLLAYYEVKIFKKDLQGKCDSIAYSFSDSIVELHDNPILWSDQNQLTADSIELRIANGEIHSIFLDKSAFIISEVDSLRYNQIKGKEMTGYFKGSKLSKIEVRGNGQTTYFTQDEDEKFIGVNVAESSDIDITINNQEIQEIMFINQPKATMYPIGELDPVTELRYRGFSWRIDEKPLNKNSLFK